MLVLGRAETETATSKRAISADNSDKLLGALMGEAENLTFASSAAEKN